MIKKMFSIPMKESLEKEIDFSYFLSEEAEKETEDDLELPSHISPNTLRAYIDYVYLGADEFFQRVQGSHLDYPIDIVELFKLAHYLEAAPLIDCCTNMMSFTDEILKDSELVKALAKRYKNFHLQELLDHLTKDEDKVIIKG